MSYNSKYKGEEVERLLDSIGNKVDKVDGKQLSTEDFTTLLKQKLDGLSNYDDTEIQETVSKLRTDLDTLVSGDTTTAIKTFNEVTAFLDGISDTEDLSSIIASIEQQIAAKAGKSEIPTKVSQLENDSDFVKKEDVDVPDEEDITSVDNKLKFKDRTSDDGMGYVILRKDKTLAEQVTKTNTIYEIRYDFDLDGKEVTIPSGCTLKFEGGALKNGIINGKFGIENPSSQAVLYNISGSYTLSLAKFSWFECGENLSDSINNALNHTSHLLLDEGTYEINKTLRPQSNQTIEGIGKVVIKSNISSYIHEFNNYKDGSIVNVAAIAIRGIEDGIDYSKYPSASGDYVYGKGIALASNNVYNQNYVIVADKNEMSNINIGDWLLVSSGLGYWHYVTQEMALVDYIEGNYIYFKNALRYSYSTKQYSLSNWYKEYDVVTQPGGTTVGYPDFSTFEACCVRKITPKENILIKNIILDISSNSSVSNLGLLIMLGRNIKTVNVNIVKGRLWTCDSQDVEHVKLKTGYSSFIGNGSNGISLINGELNEGFQIEEGCANCTFYSCTGTSNNTPNSIIANSKNISIISCRFRLCSENNVALGISKCKNIAIINSEITGGSSAVVVSNPTWSSNQYNPFEIEGYNQINELTEYYDSNIVIIGGKVKSYGNQTSIYNSSLRYLYLNGCDIDDLPESMNVEGFYTSNKKAHGMFRSITSKEDVIVNKGKGHVKGLLHLSEQLNLDAQTVISRGLWAGENNGGGTEIEGKKSWTALGVRNQGDENLLLRNNTEFGLFHLDGEDFLRFKMGAGQYYRMMLNDGYIPSFTENTAPSVDRYGAGVPLFMSDKQRPVYKAFRYENGVIVENSYYGYDGYSYLYNRVGFTSERPFPNSRDAGFCYYDKTINKPIWWNGESWVEEQDKLISGTNIKTINGTSILGSGNIVISGGGSSSGLSSVAYPLREIDSSEMVIEPNTYYQCTTAFSYISISLAEGDSGFANEYIFEIRTSNELDFTTVTLPDNISWINGEPNFEADKTYIISIVNNIGLIVSV